MSDGVDPAVGTAPTVEAAPGTTRLARAGDTTIDDGTAAPAGGASIDGEVGALAEVDPQHYELRGEHARGGLGRILRARDRRLGRPVAVKELLHDSGEARARFVREVEITAGLQHPGVVPIYEAGRWPGGKPFYAMRLVAGRTLTEVIAAAPTVRDRIALLPTVIAVAETVAYAHDRRVVHRDLKPSNVLVGDFGETVVIDWGLARNLDDAPVGGGIEGAGAAVDVGVTVTGQVLGTPAYMAPEQARGEVVDARADVYAIGALLYHVLAGASPYRGATGNVVAAVLAAPPPPLASVCPGLAPDLLAIVDKAMARAAADRYPDAAALAADLRRFTTGQLVTVHRYSTPVLIRRWIARHRAAVGVAALALAALLVVSVVSIVNVVAARDRARASATVATARAAEVVTQRNQLLLQQAESALETDPTTSLAWLEQYPLDGAEWGRVRSIAADAVSRGVARAVLAEQLEEVVSVAISADTSRIATCTSGMVTLWDTGTRRALGGYPQRTARYVTMTADGKTLASFAQNHFDVWLWTLGDPRPRRLQGHTGFVTSLSFTRDERQVVTSSRDGTVRVWDLSSGRSEVLRGHQGGVVAALPLSDGVRIASVGEDGTVRIWREAGASSRILATISGAGEGLALGPDEHSVVAAIGGAVITVPVEGGRARVLGHHERKVTAIAVHGDEVISASMDRSVRIWSLSSDAPASILGHDAEVFAVAVRGDGVIATGDARGNVRLWRLGPDGTYAFQQLRGHRLSVYSAAFSRDGQTLVTASADRTARVWTVGGERDLVLRASSTDLFQVAYVLDGAAVVATSRDGDVRTWDLRTGRSTLLGHVGRAAYALTTSVDGKHVFASSWDGRVVSWDLERGTERTLRTSGGAVWGLSVSRDGRWLAVAADDGAFLGPLPDGPLRPLGGHQAKVHDVAFSPDGAVLASTSDDQTIRLWRVPSGDTFRVLRGHADTPVEPTFTPDGRGLLTACGDGTLRFWDVATGDSRVLRGHHGDIRAAAISPSGELAASGGRDGSLWLWQLSSGSGRRLGHHDGEIRDVAFAPDGRSIATGGFDNVVRIWDVASGSDIPLRGHGGQVHRVAFRPDGGQVASVSADGTLRLWSAAAAAAVPTAPGRLQTWMEAHTTVTIAPR